MDVEVEVKVGVVVEVEVEVALPTMEWKWKARSENSTTSPERFQPAPELTWGGAGGSRLQRQSSSCTMLQSSSSPTPGS